jgi:hypothetical protein
MTGPDVSPGRHVVVGAGPAGFYLTAGLIKDDGALRVDASIDCRLPSGWCATGSRPTTRRSSLSIGSSGGRSRPIVSGRKLPKRWDDVVGLLEGKVALVTGALLSSANPVLNVHIGPTSDGLPLGMQIAGPVLGERTVLRVGHAHQPRTNWHQSTPVYP